MNTFSTLLAIIGGFNNRLLSFGRSLACVAMVLMVFCILLQIFYRYALNNALPWPEEAARALTFALAAKSSSTPWTRSSEFFRVLPKSRSSL